MVPEGAQRRRRRRFVVLAVALVLLAVLVALVVWLTRRDTADPVSLEDAAARTTEGTTEGEPESRDRPAPGVYEYEGSGRSSLSVPPLAQDQGPTIPGTVEATDDGCWTLRIDYSTNHWQTWDYCRRGDDLVELGGQTWQRWQLGPTSVTNLTDAACDDLVVVDPERSPGDEWEERCSFTNDAAGGEVVSEGTSRVVGEEDVEVGGRTVRTVHITRQRDITGAQTGTERTDAWFALDTGLPVRNERQIRVRTPTPVGDSTFEESGSFQLASLEPVA